jgi:hypothetical protein
MNVNHFDQYQFQIILIVDITITPSTPSPLHQQELEDTTSFELRLSKDSSWKTLEENVEETIS